MKINHKQLYQKLGSLFYAIAMADKNVRKTEEKALMEKINSIWLPLENTRDEFGTDAAYYIFFVFDHLQNEDAQADAAFDEFARYYHEHAASIDSEAKANIMQTAEAIADAYHRKNKQESAYLKRLKELMK